MFTKATKVTKVKPRSTSTRIKSYNGGMPHQKLKIGLCSIPCYGHAKPLILFGEQLVEAGHEVSFFTSLTMIKYCKEICRNPRVVFIGLEDGLQPESDDFFLGKPAHVKTHPVWYARDCMKYVLVDAIQRMEHRLDVLVSDHLTWAGSFAAKELSIPHVGHVTWPLHILEETGLIVPSSSAVALRILWHTLRGSKWVPKWAHPHGPPRALLTGVQDHLEGGLVLVASSFGLDVPRPLPPLVKLIGRGGKLETVEGLQGDPELKAFLDKNNDIVLVTFGSRVPPSKEQVVAVAHALLAGGWAVVWTCKIVQQGYLPEAARSSDRFFVRAWLPQAATLAHPNIRAAITHCGMGGLWECASNGVPIVPLPFLLSADQPVNARAAVKAGFAAMPSRQGEGIGSGLWDWLCGVLGGQPNVTAEALREAVWRALYEPDLREGAKRIQAAVLSARHGQTGVLALEAVSFYGIDHLRCPKEALSDTPWGTKGSILMGAAAVGAAALLVQSHFRAR
ncbi:unnamed protein product [Choristocarpus tenellus]